RGMLAFFRSLTEPRDAAAHETALRLLWGCPVDLIQKVQAACTDMPVFDPDALRGLSTDCGYLSAWLAQAEEWLPLVKKEKPRLLVEQWAREHGASEAFTQLRGMAVFHKDFPSLWKTLALGQEADLRRAAGKGWESGAVRLMTLHGSKGLEFPAVILAGVKAGALPLESSAHPADFEEERRLFFVGMTRAREELILTTTNEPSVFVDELPESVSRETVCRRPRPAEQLSLF
ncbi:MAG TPA: ATP-binding domain-containing protein, partial [Candidatus Agathobaculum stercoravium]|nr:ATP-binding domain-containing protein [Candidatus Agathobaculum stercoravium]